MAATKISFGRQTDLNANSNRITGVSDPTGASDAANKSYVDAAAAGIDWKASVRVATTANGALATAYENGDAIDGVTLATGDRILIKNQSTASENGIYTVNASGSPTRATDADSSAEVNAGMAVFVEVGTTNADTGWILTTDNPITLGTTGLTFTQFTSLGQVTAGDGLTKTGSTINVVAGSTKLTVTADAVDVSEGNLTLDNLGGTLGIGKGGTGQTTANAALNALLPSQTNNSGKVLQTDATNASWVTPSTGRTFTRTTITGSVNGSNTAFTLGVTPAPAGSEQIFQNGQLLNPGSGNDYTISGTSVTFITAPASGDVLQAFAST